MIFHDFYDPQKKTKKRKGSCHGSCGQHWWGAGPRGRWNRRDHVEIVGRCFFFWWLLVFFWDCWGFFGDFLGIFWGLLGIFWGCFGDNRDKQGGYLIRMWGYLNINIEDVFIIWMNYDDLAVTSITVNHPHSWPKGHLLTDDCPLTKMWFSGFIFLGLMVSCVDNFLNRVGVEQIYKPWDKR